MGSEKHRKGGKFKGHTSVIEAACPLVDMLANHEEVSGIVIAIIEQANSVAHRVAISHKTITAGLEVKVRGNKFVQVFYVYTSTPDTVIAAIEDKFPKPEDKPKKPKGKRKGNKTRPTAAGWEAQKRFDESNNREY